MQSGYRSSEPLKATSIEEVRNHVQSDFGLVRGHHVTGIVYLQKGQSLSGSRQALALPLMLFGRHEFLRPLPRQGQRPRAIANVVADKVDISSVNQGRDAIIEQIGHVSTKVFHPVGMEFHVDSEVASRPRMRMLLVHIQFLHSGFEIQPRLDMREVITQRTVLALNANIIGVQTGHLIGTRQARIAQ